jgi:hypothetical protein
MAKYIQKNHVCILIQNNTLHDLGVLKNIKLNYFLFCMYHRFNNEFIKPMRI